MARKRPAPVRPARHTASVTAALPVAPLAPAPPASGGDALAALDRLRLARRDVEVQVLASVAAARAAGRSWTEIGARLGVSAQAVQKRYGSSRAEA